MADPALKDGAAYEHLIRIVCSPAPDGHVRGARRLLEINVTVYRATVHSKKLIMNWIQIAPAVWRFFIAVNFVPIQ